MKNDKDLSAENELIKRPIAYPSVMSISEAASYLTISKYFLYMLVKGGCIPYAKIGKRIIFRQQDLYDWIGQNLVMPSHNILNGVDEDDC